MRRHEVVPGLTTLALALTFAAAFPHAAWGRARPREAAPVPAPAPATPSLLPVAAGTDSVADFDLRLARAVERFAAGDPAGVVALLGDLDFGAGPVVPDADRAAFLLAQAYRALGSRERFARVAEQVSGWERETGYTRWLASQLALDRTEATGRVPEGLDALFPNTAAFAQAFRALADRDSNPGSGRSFDIPGALDTTSLLGADLAGAMAIARAAEALERGEDARPGLSSVPAASRYRSRARQLAATAALERGDRAAGAEALRALLAEDSLDSGRRDALRRLAAEAMDAGRWREAESLYAAAERDWQGHREYVDRLLTSGRFDPLWNTWRSPSGPSRSLPLSGVLSGDLNLQWSWAAAAPAGDAPGDPAQAMAAGTRTDERWPIPSPPTERWNRVTAATWAFEEAGAAVRMLERDAEAERYRLEAHRRYLSWGSRQVGTEDSLLAAGGAALDSIGARLDAWDRRLQEVRDQAMLRIAARSRAIAAESERQALAMRGLRHLHLEGPHRADGRSAPPGYPSADSLVGTEQGLTAWIAAAARRIETEGPALIARSYRDAWRPGLIDRVGLLSAGTREARAWAARLDGAVDSSIAAARGSARLTDLERAIARRVAVRDSLDGALAALRDTVAREALEAARAAIESEREGLDYGLAASMYAAAVGMSAPDAADSNGLAPGVAVADPVVDSLRAVAIERFQLFLTEHPQSQARAEFRFRLADLLLSEERGTFRARMAEYVRRQSEGLDPGPLPVLGDEAALDLYRSILREDRDFPHLDAVRFNAGMILADGGDPEAEAFFTELVRLHPGSIYAPEAWVRLGDLRFAQRRFREASDCYARGALGPDATLRAVATYKLGWAGFRDERFLDAATAFRDVLDLYASGDRARLRADVEGESETYLVQALARAGGAATFAQLYDGTRARPHEERILNALALHFRRYDRYADAIDTDRMALERAPSSPNALRSARRITECFERWNDPSGQRGALAEMAPRFAPGGSWATAQSSDSVREAGAEFSRRAWVTLASYHLREARARDGASDWREALAHYETLIDRFPRDPETTRHHLLAGEAAARLQRYPAAMAHYDEASRTGEDSLRTVADWQRVATADEWYQRRRSGRRDGFEPPVDSLARAVLAAADRYLERHSGDPRGAALTWRQGQIGLAHEWYERAAADFERLARDYPENERAPQAAALRADCFVHLERFADAGAAYQAALAIAERAGVDSLAERTREAIPICFYRDAEAAVAADSTDFRRHARLFEKVAAGWPSYRYADVAQYRAGRAYLRAGDTDAAVAAFAELGRKFPSSEFAPDAHLEMARALEQQGRRERAAEALAAFAARFPDDSTAGEAMLKAADLLEAEHRQPGADSLRLAYVRLHPDDHATEMEIYEALARRDLASVGPKRSLASLLPPEAAPAAATKKGSSGAKAAAARTTAEAPRPAVPSSYLAQYLRRAREHPELASASLQAEVRFRQGEEARVAAAAVPISLPLDQSIRRRQKYLDEALADYKASVNHGVAEWAHASTFRIGQTLVEFGAALEGSERPADLQGDDRTAYEDVLLDRAQVFYDRGEGVWVDLLRQKGADDPGDPWLTQAQHSLWGRLGLRFACAPEAEYPVVAADAPPRPRPAKAAREGKKERRERRATVASRQQASGEGGR